MSPRPHPFTLVLPLILPIMAASPAPSSLFPVDFSKMGSVALGGSFAGLDWWSESSPFASASSSSSTPRFSAEGDTVFIRDGDGNYRPIGATNAGGVVAAVCWLEGNGGGNGTVFAAGQFEAVGGQEAANVARYDMGGTTWSAMGDGLDGQVDALYCDADNGEVWFGGEFAPPAGSSANGTNVARWSTSSSSWSSVPFGGLDGPVHTIQPSSSSSILFGGSFNTLFSSSSSTNLTTNYTSAPSAPPNTSTTGNSGYLTPVTLPGASSASGELTITAGPSSDDGRYNNPRVLLCPGSGTWLAREGQVSEVTLLGYNFWRATGARVANGLVEGRGTTTFCITSIPDNEELTMTYTDPESGQNKTCDSHCPLSTDKGIQAQDFMFQGGVRNMTGFKMQLKGWTGSGAGLNSVQLLSDGAYASAASEGNMGVCPDSATSRSQLVGDWTQGSVSTSLPATTAYYIKSTVPASDPGQPGVTFYPLVSSAGYYDVYLSIPACSKTEDCGSRTSVDIEVFPGGDGLGYTSTISQETQVDLKELIYSGWMDKTSDDFTPTVILQLPRDPTSTGSGQYSIVAQSVELHLTGIGNPDEPARTSPGGIVGQNGTIISNTTRTTNTSRSTAWGVYEWNRNQVTVNVAGGGLPNTTETSITKLGYALGAARNASTGSGGNWTVNAIIQQGDVVIVGGSFAQTGNWTNVLAINTENNATQALAEGGLDGVVLAGVSANGRVYLGGDFTGTSAGSTDLQHVAAYDPSDRSWHALAGGVDGAVLALTASGDNVLVSGNFTHVIAENGTTTATGGYAIYDTKNNAWSTSGVLFGSLRAASIGKDSSAVLAGRVMGASSNSVDGVAVLTTGSSGAEISNLRGLAFSATGSGSSSSSNNNGTSSRTSNRRDLPILAERSWISRLTHILTPRDDLSTHLHRLDRRAPISIPVQPATAPAILAAAYWRNTSASGNPEVTILGGNFSSSSTPSIGGLAFHSNGALSGPSPGVSGVVRSMVVVDDTLYVSGSNVNVTGVGAGLVAYDLKASKWATSRVPALQAANANAGGGVRVNVMKQRQGEEMVVVAGNFAQAGSLSCAGVCLWSTRNSQWSTPGSGLSSGEVKAIDFAGSDYDTLVAAGSFVLSTGETASVATYSFSNLTWTALGSLPGPALAVAVDNSNPSSIFAAGYSDSDNSAYLSQWTGSSWNAQNSSLLPGSIVNQLAFVPLTREHSAKGSIESNRMLMMTGTLYLDGAGNATSALYDGEKTHPYLVGVSNNGMLGSASGVYYSESNFDFSINHYLARGLVVLVAIAIATGLILLLILLFLLIGYCLRRKERKDNAHQEMYNKDIGGSDGDVGSTHQNVLHTVQDALQATLLGGAGAAVGGTAAQRSSRNEKYRSADSAYTDAGPSHHAGLGLGVGAGTAAGIGAAGTAAGHGNDNGEEEEYDDEVEPRETTMRYDFGGPELQPGEMEMRAGQAIIVIDDQQSGEWWFCRDPADGREGVVPASYVW